jgi:hypothetical protein
VRFNHFDQFLGGRPHSHINGHFMSANHSLTIMSMKWITTMNQIECESNGAFIYPHIEWMTDWSIMNPMTDWSICFHDRMRIKIWVWYSQISNDSLIHNACNYSSNGIPINTQMTPNACNAACTRLCQNASLWCYDKSVMYEHPQKVKSLLLAHYLEWIKNGTNIYFAKQECLGKRSTT